MCRARHHDRGVDVAKHRLVVRARLARAFDEHAPRRTTPAPARAAPRRRRGRCRRRASPRSGCAAADRRRCPGARSTSPARPAFSASCCDDALRHRGVVERQARLRARALRDADHGVSAAMTSGTRSHAVDCTDNSPTHRFTNSPIPQLGPWYVEGMPLVSLDGVSIAFGHLPLLDDVALQIEPRERVSIIGRNGTGKSTLLKILSGELAPDSGTVWRQPALRVARLEQDVPLSAAPLGLRRRRRRAHAPSGGRRGVAARAPRRSHPVAARAAGRRDRRHAVGRLAAPRAAGARARRPAGSAAARRADQPPGHRGDHLARELPRRLRRRGHVRHARPRVPPAARDADRRARSRPADVVARRLRDVPAPEGGGARQRGRASRRSSTRSWPKRRCGCARASRRGGRGTKAGCAR